MSEQVNPPNHEAEPLAPEPAEAEAPEPVHYEQETITQEDPDPSPDALRRSLHT
jgi:hypothetical protein